MEGSGITSLLKKTIILEFKLQNVKYLIDTTTTPHCSSTIFPVLNSLEIKQAFYLKEIFHGELPTGSLKKLRSLKLSYLHRLTHIWKTNSRSECGVLRNILGVVQVLKIEHCFSLKGIVIFEYDDEEEVFSFQSLTELTLVNLSNFTGISKNISEGLPENSSSDVITQPLFHSKIHFPVLSKLHIEFTKVKEIWNNQLSAESFYELKSLKVDRCDELLHLIPANMQNRLTKLEDIQVRGCSSLEEIFEFRRLIVDNEGDATAFTISESGIQGTQINKMMSFKQSRQAFQNLREISILGCESLRTLLSPSIARGLVKLQTLEVIECKKIEEIVAATAEGEETVDDNMFPQLHTLTLTDLPNLGSFSQGKYNFKWPLVKKIEIFRCYNMEKFCLGSLSTPKEVKIDVQYAGESVLRAGAQEQ